MLNETLVIILSGNGNNMNTKLNYVKGLGSNQFIIEKMIKKDFDQSSRLRNRFFLLHRYMTA